jgi:hypothetical protein
LRTPEGTFGFKFVKEGELGRYRKGFKENRDAQILEGSPILLKGELEDTGNIMSYSCTGIPYIDMTFMLIYFPP